MIAKVLNGLCKKVSGSGTRPRLRIIPNLTVAHFATSNTAAEQAAKADDAARKRAEKTEQTMDSKKGHLKYPSESSKEETGQGAETATNKIARAVKNTKDKLKETFEHAGDNPKSDAHVYDPPHASHSTKPGKHESVVDKTIHKVEDMQAAAEKELNNLSEAVADEPNETNKTQVFPAASMTQCKPTLKEQYINGKYVVKPAPHPDPTQHVDVKKKLDVVAAAAGGDASDSKASASTTDKRKKAVKEEKHKESMLDKVLHTAQHMKEGVGKHLEERAQELAHGDIETLESLEEKKRHPPPTGTKEMYNTQGVKITVDK